MEEVMDQAKINAAVDKLLGIKEDGGKVVMPKTKDKELSHEEDLSKLGKGKDTLGDASTVVKGKVAAGKVHGKIPGFSESIHGAIKRLAAQKSASAK